MVKRRLCEHTATEAFDSIMRHIAVGGGGYPELMTVMEHLMLSTMLYGVHAGNVSPRQAADMIDIAYERALVRLARNIDALEKDQ